LPIKVFDFFSGCGGTSCGFKAAGLDVLLGIDSDTDSQSSFKANFPNAEFICKDICKLQPTAIEAVVAKAAGHPVLFSACAPCQPFSRQNTLRKAKDPRVSLLNEFSRFVVHFLPDYIFVENVPGIQRVSRKKGPLPKFMRLLRSLNYRVRCRVVASDDYGVPQKRMRLVLIASLGSYIAFPRPTHGPGRGREPHSAVWDWIGDLPPIEAGGCDTTVPNHQAAALSPINLERIRATPEGGGRRDWPERLRLDCHQKAYKGHTDVYGRMKRNQPSTGLTTRCISLSNGRFGHPTQHRAISVREAACIQTFPRDFIFHGSMASMARQIGNAVPTRMAEVFGRNFAAHAEMLRRQERT
jgi:DNA (cytosine-5)-methyltransferase 1